VRDHATYDPDMGRWAKVAVLACLVCATGYLAGTHESRATGATAANLAPPNDDFADAAPLVGAAGARDGTTACATLENGEEHSYRAQGSVWFRWRAPWSGWATFHTCGARFDAELNVYTGASLLGVGTGLFELRRVRARARVPGQPLGRGGDRLPDRGVHLQRDGGGFTLRWGRNAERTSTHGSCFFSTRGVLRWCLGRSAGKNNWSPCQAADVYKGGSRYWVEEGHTVFGYVRPAGPGRWRAMVAVYRGWSRDGTIVRAAGGRWIVSSRGRTLGFARGPWPVAVGAYRLLAGNC
jgi:hypothetical protein